MNDSNTQSEAVEEPSLGGNAVSEEDAPRFGALDIVEAFTAMRHEWRGQTRETRALAEQMQAVSENLQSLESKLLACVADKRPDDSEEARQLALLIVETDHQFSRAVTAIAQWETNQRLREESERQAVEHYFASMNWMARRFARPLLSFLDQQRAARPGATNHPAIEGLNMVLSRLRRMMRERDVERLDVEGQPFDADTMHAIGAVASTDCAAGNVAEQLSPAYRWRGELLRFAEVRVAK